MTKTTPPKQSDLGVRAASAVVMIAVAGTALWLGGWVWTAFVALVALGVLWEWWGLVRGFSNSSVRRSAWIAGGVGYVGFAASTLVVLRSGGGGFETALGILAIVVAVDIGAYFAGRTIGGPKIAPSISPSKTWAGLIGGAAGAGLIVATLTVFELSGPSLGQVGFRDLSVTDWAFSLAAGAVFAVFAQAGDFFESWMKRRAGMKDSGSLIPGHGGLFDRVDGLLAVCFAMGVLAWAIDAYWAFFGPVKG